jgi:hypothetical protein
MTMKRIVFLFLIVALAAGCTSSGTAIDKACKHDSDCPQKEMKCVPSAGVCVGFETPLEAVDAGRPD